MKVVGNKMILNDGTEIEIDTEPPKNNAVRWIACAKHPKIKYPANRAMCIMCSKEIWKKQDVEEKE